MTRLIKWETNADTCIGIDTGDKVILVGFVDEEERILADFQAGKIDELVQDGIGWLGEDAFLDWDEVESDPLGFEVLD